MTPTKDPEESTFDTLMKLGFELEGPQDEFSFQPDSGGNPDGRAGAEESGVEVDLDAMTRSMEDAYEDPLLPVPGESEWSQGQRLPESVESSWGSNDDELGVFLVDRIHEHPQLSQSEITLQVNRGTVSIVGVVMDLQTSRLVEEVISSSPGVLEIRNLLSFPRAIPKGG